MSSGDRLPERIVFPHPVTEYQSRPQRSTALATLQLKSSLAIRHRRKARKLSQEKLAEHTNVHRNYIGLIELGEQNITIESLVKLAKALKCKVMNMVVDAGI